VAKIYFDNHSLDLARAKIFNSLNAERQFNLFDVILLTSGDYLPKSKMEDGKYKVYGGGGLTQCTHSKYNLEYETIGIGRVGARCGCAFIIEQKSWITDNALYVSKFKKKYDLSFLNHYLNHIKLNQFANQSAQPVISQRGIAKCTIPDIEFNKQQEIGLILNAIEKGEDFADVYNIKSVLEFERNLSLLNAELDQQQTYLQLLRQTILQEAVQGKLTKQNSKDEPATELLKRIKAEKQKLIKAGKLKKEKELPPITEDEIPFELPKGWVWCRLSELVTILGDGLHGTPEYSINGEYYFINGNNLNGEKIEIKNGTKRVNKEEFFKYQKEMNSNTIFVSINGTLGNLAFYNNEKIVLGKSACYFNLLEGLNKYYMGLIIKSPYFIQWMSRVASATTIKNISLNSMRNLLIPLPPITEQQRIVAKVQQLQQQLSQLEAQVQQSRQYAQQLLQSVLKEAFEEKGKVYEMGEEKVWMVAEE